MLVGCKGTTNLDTIKILICDKMISKQGKYFNSIKILLSNINKKIAKEKKSKKMQIFYNLLTYNNLQIKINCMHISIYIGMRVKR